MMIIEPTLEQRTQFQKLPQGQLALVQFISIKDQTPFAQYLQASARAVKAHSGQRTHHVQIDQILAGGEMPFQAITVDRFPSRESALLAFEATQAERQDALSQIYCLAVRPADRLPRVIKALGFLSPVLGRILGTNAEKEMPRFREIANPETGPVPDTLEEMRKHDQSTPFYMMNLNKYYSKAQYASGENVSGEDAYNRYGSRILPYLISVGGYPDIIGHVAAVLVGDENSRLHDDWSDFAMVYYPSRRNFIRMMTNAPKDGAHHRDAGLQLAVLMPSSVISSGR
jgi:hypothetical protein